jgi:hypothetical protein
MIRAMQAYLNHVMGQSGEWNGRLRDDMRFLYREVLRLSRDDMNVDGQGDVRVLAALAVFTWRKANRTAAVGEWASTISGVRVPQQPVQPQQPQPQPEQPRQRPRTISP